MSSEFQCKRCGACCRWPGFVILTGDDIRSLAQGLGMDESTFVNRYTKLTHSRARLSLIEKEDGSCIFLEGDDCRVYGTRPKQCRDFPKYWTLDEGCPALEEMD